MFVYSVETAFQVKARVKNDDSYLETPFSPSEGLTVLIRSFYPSIKMKEHKNKGSSSLDPAKILVYLVKKTVLNIYIKKKGLRWINKRNLF